MQDETRDQAASGLAATVDQAALTRFVARRTRDWALAEDLVQDTLVKLMEYAERVDIADPGALAFRVAENLVRDHFRRPRNRPHAPLDERWDDDAPGPEASVMDRERLALVRQLIAQMPPKRREVLTRRRIDGQSLDAIGRAMGLSPAAVEKHLVRALAQLRAGLEAELRRERQTERGSGR